MFQSTRPHGARPWGTANARAITWFQSTRPHGARPGRAARCRIGRRFQSTRPHGARRGSYPRSRPLRSFNPRARTGRDASTTGGPIVIWRFNPRARTGRDDLLDRLLLRRWCVSIHAPARGATPESQRRTLECCSFNPRARTGRDRAAGFGSRHSASFNPRARTGRDSVILPTRISTPIVGPIAIPSHDLLISPITPIQVRKFLMITRCWRRANRQRKTRSLQVRGSKNQGTL